MLKNKAVMEFLGVLVTKDFDSQLVICPPGNLQKQFNHNVSDNYNLVLLKIKEN